MLRISWTIPTKRKSGRPLKPGDIARFELQVKVDGAPDFSSLDSVPPTADTYEIDNPSPGDYSFRVRAVDAAGGAGDWGSGAVTIPDTSPIEAPTVTLVLV